MDDDSRDVRQVREAAARYIDAVYRGDVPALRACFHPAAVMSGYLGDEFLAGDPERFFEDVTAAPSMAATGAPYVAEVTVVDVVGDVASVRVDETGFFGSLAFANWFHLVRIDGVWLIVSKLFTMRRDAGAL